LGKISDQFNPFKDFIFDEDTENIETKLQEKEEQFNVIVNKYGKDMTQEFKLLLIISLLRDKI
jgi:hypothetical protein